jgi:RNA polymerase sigma-70 factor (ECF subfamily)
VERVAKVHQAFAATFWQGVDVELGTANDQAAVILRRDGIAFAVLTVTASTNGIEQVLWTLNPAKLTSFNPATN